MNNRHDDICEMLDVLELPLCIQKYNELLNAPALGNYSPSQFLRELLETQYIEVLNNRFKTNLRLSALINKGAKAGNLKTGNGRLYNDATVEQILSFRLRSLRILRRSAVPPQTGKKGFVRPSHRCRDVHSQSSGYRLWRLY